MRAMLRDMPSLPLSSEVNFASAYRLMEGLRIAHLLPNTEILISGRGDVPGIMKELLVAMGLSSRRIVIDNQSGSTHESCRKCQRVLDQGEKFYPGDIGRPHAPCDGDIPKSRDEPRTCPDQLHEREGAQVHGLSAVTPSSNLCGPGRPRVYGHGLVPSHGQNVTSCLEASQPSGSPFDLSRSLIPSRADHKRSCP